MVVPAASPSDPADVPEGDSVSDVPAPAPRPAEPEAAVDIRDVCPYLTSADGAWRSASPHRNHRCGAVDPPAPLANEKQRRLCLTADHAGCPTFRAARASRAAMLAPGVDPAAVAAADAARRPLARSSVLILEQPRLSAPIARWPFDRAMSQVALVVLMVIAFGAVAIARFTGGDPGSIASPSPSASASASPSPSPTRRPTPSPTTSSSPSASASVAPSVAVSAAPSFRLTYVVKRGDTLIGIATTYNSTVQAIKDFNGLTSNSLKIGQELKIP